MDSKAKKRVITQEDIMNLLDASYEKCLNGIPKVSPSVEDMANDYLKKHKSKEDACKAMLRNQMISFYIHSHLYYIRFTYCPQK